MNFITTKQFNELKQDFARQIAELKALIGAPPANKLLRSEEVARILKISLSTLRRMRQAGKIPFTTVAGIVYFNSKEIQQMIDENRMPGNNI